MGFDENTGYLQQKAWEKNRIYYKGDGVFGGSVLFLFLKWYLPLPSCKEIGGIVLVMLGQKWVSVLFIITNIPCPHKIKHPLFA